MATQVEIPIAYWTIRNHQSYWCLLVSIGNMEYWTHRNQQNFLLDHQKFSIGPTEIFYWTNRNVLLDQQKFSNGPSESFYWTNKELIMRLITKINLQECCGVSTGSIILTLSYSYNPTTYSTSYILYLTIGDCFLIRIYSSILGVH